MKVLITAEGNHEPKGHHFMVVDKHGVLLDLSNVQGSLHDPTIAKVTWGLIQDGRQIREGGVITRVDGHRQVFFDQAPLAPYLEAYRARRAQIETPAPAEPVVQ